MLYNMTLSQPCICCGEPVQIDAQPALIPGRKYSLLFKCLNPACRLYRHTFDSRAYTLADVETHCRKAGDNG